METPSIPAHRFARRLWMAVVLCVAVLFSAVQPTAPVHADPGYAYYWSLTFDYEHDFNGVLSIVTGYNDNGAPQEPPIFVQTTTIPCQRVGNASVSGGFLHLNGGYVRCDFDLQRALNSAFDLCNQKVAGCTMSIGEDEYYAHFRAAAQVLSTATGEAPIFYHEDASYRINPAISWSQFTANLAPHGVIPSATQPAALGAWTSYQAFYSCSGGCEMDYFVAGNTQSVPTVEKWVPFSTVPTTIYIGYDPVQNLAAPAGTQINMLFIDPPNHGNN